MPVRPIEFGALLGVTLITKLRRSLDQEPTIRLCMVRRMTVETADDVRRMRRSSKVRVLCPHRVASQAARARILDAQALIADDLGDVAAAFHMR